MPFQRHKVIMLFGMPGVGKGTQGKLLGCIPGFIHIATGDIFRSLDPSSPQGQRFRAFSSRGELVPDELTIELWEDHVQKLINTGKYRPHTNLLVLDGIPRNPAQAACMDSHIEVLAILHLIASDTEQLVRRIKGRAEQEGRHDDADENVIRRRLQVYEHETAPVLDHYDRSKLTEIDGLRTPVEVLLSVLNVVSPIFAGQFANPLSGKK